MKEMKRIFAPTLGPRTWRRFLAKPKTQWCDGYSAKELARCWEKAWAERQDFPPEVRRVFDSYGPPFSVGLELILAIPEYQVKLPPEKARPSCNDIFVLAKTGKDLVVTMVEGKVSESFGPKMGKWRSEQSKDKQVREKELKRALGITRDIPADIRYQLLHRAASAMVVAEAFNARYAVMLVHSFSASDKGLGDYKRFLADLFGVKKPGKQLGHVKDSRGVGLFCGWVHSDPEVV